MISPLLVDKVQGRLSVTPPIKLDLILDNKKILTAFYENLSYYTHMVTVNLLGENSK